MSSRLRRVLPLLSVAAACGPPAGMPTLSITHVAVVDVERGTLLPDRTVLVHDRRIERVDSAPLVTPPPGVRTIDGTGHYLIPGLWDMHVHIEDAHTAGQLLSWGITGTRIMSGGLEETLALRQGIRDGRFRGPRLFIVGLALHGRESYASDTGPALVQTADDGRRAVDSLARRGVDFIKVHEGLSRAAWFAIAQAARQHGIRLTGHVPTTLTVEEAADSGLRSIEHMEFLPDPCLPIFDSTARATRARLPAGCQRQALERLFVHLHHNGVWLDPTIGPLRWFARRQFPSILAGFTDLTPLIRAADLPILAGTDLGSAGMMPGATLHDEMALLVEVGFPPAEALRAATRNPTLFLGLGDSLGRVDSGYVADLILLEANPLSDIHNTRRIAGIIQGGSVLPPSVRDSLRR